MLAGFTGKIYFDGYKASIDDAKVLLQNMHMPEGLYTELKICGALALAAAIPVSTKNAGLDMITIGREDMILAGAGSLYNREELIEELACSHNATDLQLMWAAWQKWGADAPVRIEGDWMLAAYDSSSMELLLARSWGHSSLYFFRGDEFLAFATHPGSLAGLPGIPHEPDIQVITQMLCAVPLAPEATCWKGISQLLPASRIDVKHRRIHEHVWWRPSQVRQIRIKDKREAVDRFSVLYSEAVKKRLRSQSEVGATLSAGLDSSSVCVLAARGLIPYGKVLHTWTAAPRYPDEACSFGSWLTDERTLASKAISAEGNVRHTIVDAAGVSPIESIRMQILRTGRPQVSAANQYWIDKILTLAAESGCSVLLTGQFGNSTVSWSPHKITLLPKWKYYPHTPWKDYLRLVRQKSGRTMRKIRKTIHDCRYSVKQEYPLLNLQFVSSELFRSCTGCVQDTNSVDHASIAEVNMNLFDIWYHNSYWNGVEVRDPTMDIKLTEFLLSLPDSMFFQDGMDRRMMRIGMEGILPDEVRLNKHRGQQSSDIVPRVRNFRHHVLQAIACIESSLLACGLLNIANMRLILQRIIKGETGFDIMKDCSRILLPGLSAGLFLASFDTDFDMTVPLEFGKVYY
ncbi:MAG: asparagine synthase-related protein [Clostridia bacterium]|nr:asparagine synthase-related protein [Clostridia bacterium]